MVKDEILRRCETALDGVIERAEKLGDVDFPMSLFAEVCILHYYLKRENHKEDLK